jgi:hypothetical protein
MKLNRALLVAAAAVLVGSVAMVGCSRADDESDDAQLAPTEQASLSGDEAAETASADMGVEQYARGGGAHAGGAHGFARDGRGGWDHGARGWDHGGWGRGGRWDGWRRDHRYFPWW